MNSSILLYLFEEVRVLLEQKKKHLNYRNRFITTSSETKQLNNLRNLGNRRLLQLFIEQEVQQKRKSCFRTRKWLFSIIFDCFFDCFSFSYFSTFRITCNRDHAAVQLSTLRFLISVRRISVKVCQVSKM